MPQHVLYTALDEGRGNSDGDCGDDDDDDKCVLISTDVFTVRQQPMLRETYN